MTYHAPNPGPAIPVPTGHNRPPGPDLGDIVDDFTRILTQRRSADVPCHISTCFNKANPHRDINRTMPDPIITDLFGFDEASLPEMGNLFCADIGILTEKLMKSLFKLTRGDTVDTSTQTMTRVGEKYESKRGRTARKWKSADFFLGRDIIVEVKYRFNSCDSKTPQIQAAKAYIDMGYKPVFLHISSNFKYQKAFEDAGWEVHVGNAAIAYINDHTGHDFEEILRRVASQPVIAAQIENGRSKMMERLKAQATRDILYGLPEIQEHMLCTIATEAPMRQRFIDHHLSQPPTSDAARKAVAARTELLSDAAFDDIAAPGLDKAYDALSLADKKEFLIRKLAELDEEDHLDILERS